MAGKTKAKGKNNKNKGAKPKAKPSVKPVKVADSTPTSTPLTTAGVDVVTWQAQGPLPGPFAPGECIDSTKASKRVDVDYSLLDEQISNARRAAEVHRRVRQWVQADLLKEGVSTAHIARELEAGVRDLVDAQGLTAGHAFPTGLSLNACAAHDTPNPGSPPVYLKSTDVLKVDFGVHVNGVIIDCAFTWAPDPKWEQLLAGVKAATNTGLRMAAVDARLCDIGAAIQETMESYEVDGEAIKPIRNLNGHSIEPHLIHAGKSVPIVKGTSESIIMEEGEFFAIETFGSVGGGRGEVFEADGYDACSHYMREYRPEFHPFRLNAPKQVLKTINQNFGSLAFCKRYLEEVTGDNRYNMGLRQLCDAGIVEAYPPLMEKSCAVVAQFEHTLVLNRGTKEILSRGEDF